MLANPTYMQRCPRTAGSEDDDLGRLGVEVDAAAAAQAFDPKDVFVPLVQLTRVARVS